jgi:hypothetical protein
MTGGSMFNIIAKCTAASLILAALAVAPEALSQHRTDTPTQAPKAAVKGDRLDIGARWAACSKRPHFHYDGACRFIGPRPTVEIGKVLVVSTDRRSVAG